MKDNSLEVKFHFGKKPISRKRVYITAMFLALAVDILNRLFKLSPQLLWELIDIIGQDFNIPVINEIILQAPELLEDRIQREVDGAIDDYNDQVGEPKIPEPDFYEEPDGDTPLGGSIGYTYPFTEKNNEQR